MVGNQWALKDFGPMNAIPHRCIVDPLLRRREDFMALPLQALVDRVAAGTVPVTVCRVFRLDEIVAAHRLMEQGGAGGKIVVLTRQSND